MRIQKDEMRMKKERRYMLLWRRMSHRKIMLLIEKKVS